MRRKHISLVILAVGSVVMLAVLPGLKNFPLVAKTESLAGMLVINEVDYDQAGTDAAEFVEIYNAGGATVNLDPVLLVLVDGAGGGATVYNTIDLPGVDLTAGDYYVVCGNATAVPNCDVGANPNTDLIQNGSPDAVALYLDGTLLDSVSYEGDTGAPYTEGSGIGLKDDPDQSGMALSRCPDGIDTDENNVDFMVAGISPGAANLCPPGNLIINEIDYDQPGIDGAEFVELMNNGKTALPIALYTLVLVDGAGGASAVYDTIDLSKRILAPGDYYVVCGNATSVANCDLEVTPHTGLLQDGAPDAVALLRNHEPVDTVSYEGDTAAPYTEGSGLGLEDDGSLVGMDLSRCPNGTDTDQNNLDFRLRSSTPGAANQCESPRLYLPAIMHGYGPPATVFVNGVVLTMEEGLPQAEALAVLGDSIETVGSTADILAMVGPQTQVIDLGGRTLMPGFVDPHTHLLLSTGTPESAQQAALEHGITTLAELYCDPQSLAQMQSLDQAGGLRVRTSLYLTYATPCGEVLGDWYQRHPPTRERGEMLRIGGVKLYADGGSCGSPAYSYDHPAHGYGDLWFTQAELNAILTDIQAAGHQAAIHALGDRAVEQVLDAIEFALDDGPNTLRHRIEHNAVVRDDLLARYAQVDPVALIFGAYPACRSFSDPPPAYQGWEWRWPDLLAASPGVHFAWHSDWQSDPGWSPLSPLMHLYSMVTPFEADGDGSICATPQWLAHKLLTVEQVLPMMTIEAAYALFRDEEVGSLRAGKLADLIILSDNPLTVEPNAIKDLQVWMTMVGGRVAYCAPGHDALCPGG